MQTRFDAYRKSFRSNPDAFIEGARSFCKSAADDESLWDTIRPWLIGLGGGYLALKLGDAWGRHAQRTGNKLGPVVGPVSSVLNGMLPKDRKVRKPWVSGNGGEGK